MSEGPTRARPLPTVVRYAKVRVSVTRGPNTGLYFESAGTPVRIGTSTENDLVLTDDTVSRRHAELQPTPLGMRVRDVESTNGIVLGGVRLKDGFVTGDFQIALGETWLAVQWLGETVDREQVQTDRFGDVLGRAPRMRELFADLERIAPSEVSLLIEGETGTGKDLIAESVHAQSQRAGGPFAVFDCGAVAPTMVESELFGHERGAFTGAHATHTGVFEQASGGTLFIDEIGELPLELQPKLLRALEKREIRRIGGRQTIAVDVRIIAATNRNLRFETQQGRFRQDLYFRLATTHVAVPPLRDRMEDLELLVEYFLGLERPPRHLSDVPVHVWEMFQNHRWPGNVRELRNAVQRLTVTPDRPLHHDHVETASSPSASSPAQSWLRDGSVVPLRIARREAGDDFERAYLEFVLQRSGGNVTRGAALAEVSRQMMQKLMRKHGMGEGR
ncbi:MAG: sigma 54-dependent Fis family transcriptional regulator [Polyangiaceae bacterium]|nr:sigma 54-dependent Fis family transcriptional regulator [Polyangiaceae bacterium]MBK8999050.1 sigma 54-dependent Fis family transcriptional regulator [Myxococcales bacterium]MCE7894311.1 FHA domain-containing protein [Sorangiineae bacterium PRO1]MCL4750048.1 sigma 54-interacting transcriptional regulator [Myxococcales bacterium]